MVDWIVNRERTNPRRFVRRIVATTGQDGIDRGEHGRVATQTAGQTDTDISKVAALRIQQVRARLQVARVFGRTPLDQTRVGV